MFSVITPVHEPHFKYIPEAYKSLLEQTRNDWEWIVGIQGDGSVPLPYEDTRIRFFRQDVATGDRTYPPIGKLKRNCTDRATGDIIVELDADDILHPECLAELHAAFDDPRIAMAYSNNAQFEDGTWKPRVFDKSYGWRCRPVMRDGHELNEHLSFDVGPQALRSVLFSPDHVRAWRRTAYEAIGGHDATIQNGDDHELMCRLYLKHGSAGFKHIDKCLYFYRCSATNTCQNNNTDVFTQVDRTYCKYSRDIATKWARDNGLRLLDLGGRFNAWPEYEVVDIEGERGKDIICDLEMKWPFQDDSVGVIRASHIFEHLRDPIHTMNEAYRVLAPGGWLFIEVPSTDGRGAFQDPTHVTFFNEHSFWYYTNQQYARFIQPKYKGRFQSARCVTFFASEFEKLHNIPWVQADLICLKPPYSDNAPGAQLI